MRAKIGRKSIGAGKRQLKYKTALCFDTPEQQPKDAVAMLTRRR
jgi:hypothetical protein